MPGVEVMAEATEALIAGSGIRSPPAWLKYVLATFLVLMTTFAFYRGEPATDIDSVFVATNLALLSAAFVGLTFFGFFFDVFASVAFVSLIFGLVPRVRGSATRARGRQWRLPARLRSGHAIAGSQSRGCVSCPTRSSNRRPPARRRREYQRRLRRFLYAGSDAVMLEGVVERKSWLHEALSDLMVLVWHGESEDRGAHESALGSRETRTATGGAGRAPARRRQRARGVRLHRDRRRQRGLRPGRAGSAA